MPVQACEGRQSTYSITQKNNRRSPSKGNKGDKGKKPSKEEIAKTPCIYHAQGKCNRGDKCYYKHEDKAAAATKDAPKRTNSPSPKKDKKGKESNAAPCLVERCQKFACIAMTQPKATSSSVQHETHPIPQECPFHRGASCRSSKPCPSPTKRVPRFVQNCQGRPGVIQS